jgi:hypothetical protein
MSREFGIEMGHTSDVLAASAAEVSAASLRGYASQ